MSDDLTRCPGGGCPLRDDCYRFRAEAFGRYDAFGTPPYDPTTGRCAAHRPLRAERAGEDAVRLRAYFQWQREGRPEGRADAHWAAAEAGLDAEFRARLRPPSGA